MNNSTIQYGKIIQKARIDKKLSQDNIAHFIGVRKSTVSNYETGYSKPSLETFEKIGNILGYSLIEFLSLDPVLSADSSLHFPRALQPGGDCYIPFYSSKSLKAGNFEHQNYMDNYLTLPSFMLESDPESYLCAKMADNSMSGDGIFRNDCIIVRKSQTLQNKSIALVQRISDNEIFVRRYFRDGHIIAFIPSNDSDEYSIIRTDERNCEFKIIGYVEKFLTNVR